MVSLSRPYPFNFFKGCLSQNLLSLLLNILSQIILALLQGLQFFTDVKSGVTDLAVFLIVTIELLSKYIIFNLADYPKKNQQNPLWVVQIKR